MKTKNESLIRLKRFQVDEKRRQVTQIEIMVNDFERMATDLDQQVEAEQQRTGIDDMNHFAYSTFAKAAKTRHDNLMTSINDLKMKLEQAQDDLAEAVEDLKRVEMIDERDVSRERQAQEQMEQDELDEVALRRY